MSKNNDEIFNNLELLEEYAHIAPDNAYEVISLIIKKRKPIKPKLHDIKGFGKVQGKTHTDLIKLCLAILDHIKYLKIKESWSIIQFLYNTKDESIQKEVLKLVEKLSRYNLFVLQHTGYKVQKELLADIKKWKGKKINNQFDLAQITLREILSPTFEGHSMSDYRTLTFHSGPLNINDEIKAIRNDAILLLESIYKSTNNLSRKTKIIQALNNATHTPHSHIYGKDMEDMVVENVNKIIDFYLEMLPDAENEIIQDIDEQRVWFFRRYKDSLPDKINKLEEALLSNSNYNMFKVFVGYEGRLDPEFDYNKEKEYRTSKIQEFLSNINDDNFDDWRKKILLVVKNYFEADPGGYNYFHIFLQGLGERKPYLAIKLILENQEELTPFLASLLSGIWKSESQNEARKIMSAWINKGERLYICAFVFSLIGDVDMELLDSLYKKLKENKDVNALNNLVKSIVQTYAKKPDDLKLLLLNTIKTLETNNNHFWVNHIWFKVGEIFINFTEHDFEIIINCLLNIESIDYQIESILKPIGEQYPKKLISLFHDRVVIKTKRRQDIHDRYDAIPYDLQQLAQSLKKHEDIFIPMVLGWYEEGGKEHQWLFGWEASQLLEKVFPGFSTSLENALIKLVNRGDKKSREIIFSVISKYEGQDFLWNIVSSLVQKYKGKIEYKEIRDSLLGYLSQTGVVSGEDGFVKAFQEKKNNIQKYTKDSILGDFIKEYEEYLDIRIRDEQKRTDERIELMKRGLN